MDINLMRRVKKQQLTEQAQSQIEWLTIGEVPFITCGSDEFLWYSFGLSISELFTEEEKLSSRAKAV